MLSEGLPYLLALLLGALLPHLLRLRRAPALARRGLPPAPAARPKPALPAPRTTTLASAPFAKSLDATASAAQQPMRPLSAAGEATATPTTKLDETVSAPTGPSAEMVASAMALAQRVRDLGLHLGEVVVSGVSVGLPNAATGKAVFDPSNLDALMRGENCIGPLPAALVQAQLEQRVVQVHKNARGERERRPLRLAEEVIQLASRVTGFDLAASHGISPAIVETLDTTYALAVAAGLEAMLDAGLIERPAELSPGGTSGRGSVALSSMLGKLPPITSPGAPGARAEPGWRLPRHQRDETGVIFAASFPALDSLIGEVTAAMTAKLQAASADARARWLVELRAMLGAQPPASGADGGVGGSDAAGGAAGGAPAAAGAGAKLAAWLDEQSAAAGADAAAAACGYEFNRKLLFKVLVMANSQLAEIVQAKGPNLHINAACAGTTAAISLGHDWIRAGKCKRVVVIAADNPSSDRLMPYVGIGFLALGAACVKPRVEDAAVPFDKRRSGLLLGSGAVGLVLEADTTAAAARPSPPRATVLGVTHVNSAYHASAIGLKHATETLCRLLAEVESVHGVGRAEIGASLLYVSHETFTCARNGGCAGAEATALRAAFGELTERILITNTKGMTGHAMGVCFEDAVAVAALSTGRVPPVVNHRVLDPVLAGLRLSTGGEHSCRYALHFAAGFGSQITYVLYRK